MATSTPIFVPVEVYLRTAYRPDCDYINGEVLKRNMGEKPHSRLQSFFLRFFEPFEGGGHFETLTEQRLQINSDCYRVPDVMLSAWNEAEPRVVLTPPLLCVEILSSEDRIREIQERIADYTSIGVKTSWVVDPWREVAYTAAADAVLHRVEDVLTVPGTPIQLAVQALWDDLERRRTASSASA